MTALAFCAACLPVSGGQLFERTGSHDLVWWIDIAPGVVAMLANLPINERPVARLRTQPAG